MILKLLQVINSVNNPFISEKNEKGENNFMIFFKNSAQSHLKFNDIAGIRKHITALITL